MGRLTILHHGIALLLTLLTSLCAGADCLYFATPEECPRTLSLPPMLDRACRFTGLYSSSRARTIPLTFTLITAAHDTVALTLKPVSQVDPLYERDSFLLTVAAGHNSIEQRIPNPSHSYLKGSPAAFSIDLYTRPEEPLQLSIDNTEVCTITTPQAPWLSAVLASPLISITSPDVHAESLMLLYSPKPAPFTTLPLTDAEIAERIAMLRPGTGRWAIFDFNTDPTYLRPGGSYTLAIVPGDEPGNLEIRYISGADINPDTWRRGMLKGILTPTAVASRYRLQWYDADGLPLPDIGEAQYQSPASWVITFPSLDATITLHRATR